MSSVLKSTEDLVNEGRQRSQQATSLEVAPTERAPASETAPVTQPEEPAPTTQRSPDTLPSAVEDLELEPPTIPSSGLRVTGEGLIEIRAQGTVRSEPSPNSPTSQGGIRVGGPRDLPPFSKSKTDLDEIPKQNVG